MRAFTLIGALAAGVSGLLGATGAQAAAGVDLVCFVSYANPYQAALDDVMSIGRASVMPRETALPLVNPINKIWVYSPEQLVTACQCLHNPAPANSLRERDEQHGLCPKPIRIEGPK